MTRNAKAKASPSEAVTSLAKELKSLIPKLDEEGLAFLVKQAQVHLYNMQVDALNQTIIKDVQRKNATAAKAKKTASAAKPAAKSGKKRFFDIKISPSGSGYHLLCNTQWVSFTAKEISAMAKIALGQGSDTEIAGRLYTWLSRERGDLLNTASIANKFDEKLISLGTLLRKNFKLKEPYSKL